MDSFKEEILIDCGLTKNESRVYLSLLRLGSATAVEITKLSKVHRVNVYDALERLLGKGLISTVIQANKRIYEAANPSQLGKILEEKEEALNKIMPVLKEDFKSKKEKQQVYHFFGPDGVIQAYYMMLDQNDTIYSIGGSGLNRKYLKHRHDMFMKDLKKNKIKAKVIYYEFTRGGILWKKDPIAEVRYMPDRFKTPCMIDLCGDLVVNLLPFEGNMMAIVIENKALADSYRQFFNFMWQFAKK